MHWILHPLNLQDNKSLNIHVVEEGAKLLKEQFLDLILEFCTATKNATSSWCYRI